MDSVAAALADGVAHVREALRVLLDEILRAVRAADLLVGDDDQQHVARRSIALGVGAQHSGGHHSDGALVVQRAAPPDHAVGDLGVERRMRPRLILGAHHVDMGFQHQRRGLTAPSQTCDEIETALVASDYVDR